VCLLLSFDIVPLYISFWSRPTTANLARNIMPVVDYLRRSAEKRKQFQAWTSQKA